MATGLGGGGSGGGGGALKTIGLWKQVRPMQTAAAQNCCRSERLRVRNSQEWVSMWKHGLTGEASWEEPDPTIPCAPAATAIQCGGSLG